MTAPASPEQGPTEPATPTMLACPRCGASLKPEQDWCLECGAAARTRIARTPAWRLPVFAVVFVIALSGAAAAFAFVRLSNTDDDLRAAQTAPPTTAPAPPAPTTTAPPVAVPTTTTPAPEGQPTTPTTAQPSPFTQTQATPAPTPPTTPTTPPGG